MGVLPWILAAVLFIFYSWFGRYIVKMNNKGKKGLSGGNLAFIFVFACAMTALSIAIGEGFISTGS